MKLCEGWSTRLDVELYFENGVYGAYIGSDGGSGITAEGNTPEEVAKNLANYLADFYCQEEDEEEYEEDED